MVFIILSFRLDDGIYGIHPILIPYPKLYGIHIAIGPTSPNDAR